MNVESGELCRAGKPVKLQMQPFRVLALLACRAGEVVSRQEIECQIWGPNVHIDFVGGLNFCIKQIRVALNDRASAPRYVQTLSRRGYRFVAAVERQHRVVTTSHRKMQAVLPFGKPTGNPK